MVMIRSVMITKSAAKDLRKAPDAVQIKFAFWRQQVTECGLEEVRRNPGWHDEPLKGQRQGQHSIRLSIKWRAFYTEQEDGTVTFVLVEEVNPHEY